MMQRPILSQMLQPEFSAVRGSPAVSLLRCRGVGFNTGQVFGKMYGTAHTGRAADSGHIRQTTPECREFLQNNWHSRTQSRKKAVWTLISGTVQFLLYHKRGFLGGFLMRASVVATLAAASMLTLAATSSAMAGPFFFSTGNPDGLMASASRPDLGGVFEIETADDFALTSATSLSSATFTGLIPTGSSVLDVAVEIYRVFPNDSDAGRTSGSPLFSTSLVPTRVNSPSDVAFDSRDSSSGTLSFSTSVLSSSFTAFNSVDPGGIHPRPNQTTGGTGPVTGMEVQFNVDFTTLLSLPADHYFFVPLVELNGANTFMWLSAPRPIVSPGTAFPAGFTDLQSWTRDASLDPDWLRIGTDIVGGSPAPTFNAAFSLAGTTDTNSVPEPGSLLLFGAALVGLVLLRRPSDLKNCS